MSSFLVDRQVIASVAKFITDHSEYWYLFDDSPLVGEQGCRSVGIIGQAFYEMNVRALRERYPDSYEEMVGWVWDRAIGQDYRVYPVLQVLKDWRCLLYQCTEGAVCEERLFNALQEFGHELAVDLVTKTPEYESCKWGR